MPDEIKVVTISIAQTERLNRVYRKKDKPTNVLSLRYGNDYAEILVCPSVIRREAKERGHTYEYQMTWMVVHGMLHVAGMHHEKSRKIAAIMERLEKKILTRIFGVVKNPKSQAPISK